MVLDDDPAFSGSVYDFLTQAGYEVYPFNSPAKAWDLLGLLKPDFLLLDLNMPMLDGREFVPWARKECPQMRIIICTGLDVHPENSIFLENGVKHLLKKPVSPAELIKIFE